MFITRAWIILNSLKQLECKFFHTLSKWFHIKSCLLWKKNIFIFIFLSFLVNRPVLTTSILTLHHHMTFGLPIVALAAQDSVVEVHLALFIRMKKWHRKKPKMASFQLQMHQPAGLEIQKLNMINEYDWW